MTPTVFFNQMDAASDRIDRISVNLFLEKLTHASKVSVGRYYKGGPLCFIATDHQGKHLASVAQRECEGLVSSLEDGEIRLDGLRIGPRQNRPKPEVREP